MVHAHLDLGVQGERSRRECGVGNLNRFCIPRPHPHEAIALHCRQCRNLDTLALDCAGHLGALAAGVEGPSMVGALHFALHNRPRRQRACPVCTFVIHTSRPATFIPEEHPWLPKQFNGPEDVRRELRCESHSIPAQCRGGLTIIHVWCSSICCAACAALGAFRSSNDGVGPRWLGSRQHVPCAAHRSGTRKFVVGHEVRGTHQKFRRPGSRFRELCRPRAFLLCARTGAAACGYAPSRCLGAILRVWGAALEAERPTGAMCSAASGCVDAN
jgi:hypothetical protein